MLREPFVQPYMFRLQQFEHAAVFADDVTAKQFGFAAHRLAEIVVEVWKEPPVRRDGVEIAQVQPLRGEVSHQRL